MSHHWAILGKDVNGSIMTNNLYSYEELTLNQFNKNINKAYKENYQEDNLSYEACMKTLSDKENKEVSQWIMRQYFDSTKNKYDIWYKAEINEDNVLKYISNSRSNFPHTLHAVISQHKLNKQIISDLNRINDVEEVFHGPKNTMGDVTLKDIGKIIGDVTPTMANKISDKALEKFKKAYVLYTSYEFEKKFTDYVNNLVEELSSIYVDSFVNSESLNDALADLIAQEIVKQKDLEYISSKEFDFMESLFQDLKTETISSEEAEEIIIANYKSQNNKMSIFQYSISRIIHPGEKTGRKKKEE